jgi:hypothetical protein
MRILKRESLRPEAVPGISFTEMLSCYIWESPKGKRAILTKSTHDLNLNTILSKLSHRNRIYSKSTIRKCHLNKIKCHITIKDDADLMRVLKTYFGR